MDNMDPSILTTMMREPDCQTEVHRVHSLRDRTACNMRKYIRTFIELMLVICFLMEFIKYLQAEEHLIDKIKMFVQVFNVSKTHSTHEAQP